MAEVQFAHELDNHSQYLRSLSNEDAKRLLQYPLFQTLFKDKFKIESNTKWAVLYIAGQIIVDAKPIPRNGSKVFIRLI